MGASQSVTEATPLKEDAPSYALGMTRARLRLLREPATGELYGFMGLCAPLSAFAPLGQGSTVHVRMLTNCFWLGLVMFIVSIPLRFTGMDPKRSGTSTSENDGVDGNEAGTAGAWETLTWWHSFSDIFLVIILCTFIESMAAYTMNTRSLGGVAINKYALKFEEAIRKLGTKASEAVEKSVVAGGLKEPSGKLADESGRTDLSEQSESSVSFVETVAIAIGLTSQVADAFKGEVDKIESLGPALEASYFVEGCSLVVSGWGRGVRMPKELMDAIVGAAGARPTHALQPTACFAVTSAKRELEVCERAVGSAAAACRDSPTEANAAKLERCRTDLSVCRQTVERAEEAMSTQLLDYAFFTFHSSAQKSAVLDAAVTGALFPPDASASLTVQPAPNPRDVIWQSLEATPAERTFSSLMFIFIMLVLALTFSATMSFFLTVGALLQANTPFGQTLKDVFEGDFRRLGYFFLMFLGIITSVQAIIQPIFCVYNDRGVFCRPALRLRCTTYTALFAKAGSFWMWVEFFILIMVFLFHLFFTIRDSPLYHVAVTFCEKLGVSNDDINFYFLYNAEVQGNIMLAGFVETFLMIWIVASLGRYLIAPFQKTQAGIDHWCRMSDPAHLPFSTSDGMRVIAAVTLWCGIFPAGAMWMCIYYPIAIFVVRTNLLGRFEPGPPTKPLQYRFVFVIYLPLHLLLHLALCYGVYADVKVPDPEDLNSGLWPGYTQSVGFSTAPKAVHSLFCMLMAGLILGVLPYFQRQRALREGVLTPWQVVRLFFYDGLHDDDFGTSARAAVGVHHHTSPAFFGRQVPSEAPKVVVELPAVLPAGALYQPSCGIDLLAK